MYVAVSLVESQTSEFIKRVHSGVKRRKVGEGYNCNFCDKLFSYSSYLLIH